MRYRSFHLVPLAAALTIAACDKSEDPTPSGAAPATAAELVEGPKAEAPSQPATPDDAMAPDAATGEVSGHPQPSLAGEVMRGHFDRAEEAREALIRADMERAKAAMAWLAGHELGAVLPEKLLPLQANMQAAAKTFADADNLREGGVALANTLARCGHCHKSAEEGPEIATDPLPAGDGLAGHMKRHHWAIRQLWAGLVTASDETFAAGVEALNTEPLTPEALATVSKDREQLKGLDEHVHSLAKKLKAAKTEAERNEAYGHMLATCAVCHRAMERGPQPIGPVE